MMSPMCSVPRKIAIFGHFGRGNLGDEATLAEVIRNVQRRHPSAQIRVLTINTADAWERHGAAAFPIRRVSNAHPVHVEFGDVAHSSEPSASRIRRLAGGLKQMLKSTPGLAPLLRMLRDGLQSVDGMWKEAVFLAVSFRRMRGTDLFIVAGGGQLGDYFEGPWGYPYTICKWVLLARARRAQVVFLSVGAGPIDTFLGKRFFGWSLAHATYCSFRDEHSRRLVAARGLLGDGVVYPDLVHGRPEHQEAAAVQHPVQVVGINPLPYHDPRYWAEDSSLIYQRYIETLADFAAWLIKRGRRVVLFPTQTRADPPVIADVAALVKDRLGRNPGDMLACPAVHSFEDLFNVIAQTDAVLASRFHGIVFSLLMNRPTLALSYDPKSDDLMNDVGLANFVVDIGNVDLKWLINRFEQLCIDAKELRQRIGAQTLEYRTAIERQYDELLGPSGGASLSTGNAPELLEVAQ